MLKTGFLDLIKALKLINLVNTLALQDIQSRYRRSALGPFWITISMAVMIACVGVIFGTVYKIPIQSFLPFLATGLIFWFFFSSVISESCSAFIEAERIIKQQPLPFFVYILRVVLRNIYIMAHNILIIPVLFIFLKKTISLQILIIIPSFILVILFLIWIVLLLALLSARFRDLPNTVSSLLQVIFYTTPILWTADLLSELFIFNLLKLNPFYHLLEILRSPLLGTSIHLKSYLYLIVLTFFGWIFSLIFYGKYLKRIAYWL